MEPVNLKDGINLVKQYNKMSVEEREAIQKQRFFAITEFARKHSPIYAMHYQQLGINYFMREVPCIEHDYLMNNREQWKSDELVHSEIAHAINTVRSFSFERDYRHFLLRGSKAVIISATVSSQHSAAWEKTTTVLSVFLSIDKLVFQLNELKPAMLWAYPSTLEKLLVEKKEGRLRISPVLIIAGGELLDEKLRKRLLDAFDNTVQCAYSSSVFGMAATECGFGRLHSNDDWVMFEPADADGNVIGHDEQPEKILVTNMYKTDYPVVRMTVPDRIKLHYEMCPCGNPSPWISILASSEDTITFPASNGSVDIRTNEFAHIFDNIHGISNYQIVVYANNNISVRMSVNNEDMKGFLFLQAEQLLRKFLREKGFNPSAITLDADEPLQNRQDGKYHSIIDCRQKQT